MKINTIDVAGGHGVSVIALPAGSELKSAVLINDVVQVNYMYDDHVKAREDVEIRVVDNHEEFTKDYVYLSHLLNLDTHQVRHVLYKAGSPPVATNPIA